MTRDYTHICYEWLDSDGDYHNQIINRLDNPQSPGIWNIPTNARQTTVYYNYDNEQWYTSRAGIKLVLPYKVQA